MHSRPLRALLAFAACALIAGCAPVDVRRLAGDDTTGRNNNTPGSTTARQYLLDQIEPITDPVGGSYTHAINLGTNVLGVIPGTELPDKYVIVGAHYDHLGSSCASKEVGDTICNGATDNAAGVAAALAIARNVALHPTRRSVIVDYEKLEQQIATAAAVTRELGDTTQAPAWTENAAVVYQDAVTFANVVD